jgi:type II secretory pathway component PulF
MQEFIYLAIDSKGSRVSGELEASDLKKAVGLLQARELTVLEVSPVKEKHWIFLLLQPVKGQVLAMFIRQLGVMLSAGIPLAPALRSLIPEGGPARFRKAVERLCHDLESGFCLSQAMRRSPEFFNQYMVGSVRIGEHSGNLDVALHQCADYYEREYHYARKLKTALVYPTVLFAAAGALVFFIFTFMIPRFVGLFVDLQVELPWATRLLVDTAYVIETYGMVIFFTGVGPLAAFLYLVYRYSKTGSGRMFFDRWSLRIPWYGRQIRFRMLSQYFRALGSLMTSGVTMETSLRLLERSLDREILRRTVTYQLRDVRRGKPFVTAINVYRLFPPMALEMLHVGEETGEMEKMMGRMTAYYDDEMVRGLDTIGKLVEPVVLCGMGSIVAFLLLAAFQPIYQLASSF